MLFDSRVLSPLPLLENYSLHCQFGYTESHDDFHFPQFLRDPFVWWRHSVYCLGSKEVKVLNNSSLHSILYRRLQELLALIKKDNCEIDFIHLNESYSPLCLQVGISLC